MDSGGWILDPPTGNRGSRQHYLYAIDQFDKIIATLDWDEALKKRYVLKRIFKYALPRDVEYLLYVRKFRWFTPRENEDDRTLGKPVGVELEIIVYPRPKDTTWEELLAKSVQVENERRTAYKRPPKATPKLPGIEKALGSGYKLHAFRSGGGLRVVSLSKGKKEGAYGEHPHVEEALNHLNEDFLAGGRPYNTVYGPKGKAKYPHYLTGDSMATSTLDAWILQGHTLDVWQESDEIVFRLSGYADYKMPEAVRKLTELTPGSLVTWQDRGFEFQGHYEEHMFANGDPGHSMEVISSPDKSRDAFFYSITKTGRGKDFWQAMTAAFAAPEIEVTKSN